MSHISCTARTMLCICLAALLLPIPDVLGGQGAGRQGDDVHSRLHGSRIRHWDQPDPATGDSHIVLSIPRRITPADIEAWSVALGLSPEQRAYFTSLFAHFQVLQKDKRSELLPLWEWAAAMVDDLVEAYRNPVLAADLVAMHDAEADAIREILAMERNELFLPLQPILTEQQLLRLPVVQNRRLRVTYLARYMALPLAEVDLSQLAGAVAAAGVDVPRPNDLRAIMDEYERSLTRLFAERADAAHASQRNIPRISALVVTRQLSPTLGIHRKSRLRKRGARAEESIGDLNEIYMPVVADQIEPALRQYFVDLYRIRAHPHVYPNAFDLRDLFYNAFLIDDLSDDERASLRELLEVAEDEDQVIADRMMRTVRDEFMRLTSTKSGGRPDLYREKLDAITRERRTVAENTIALLANALSEEHMVIVNEYITMFWEHAEEFRPANPLIRYYPAYPPEAPDMTLTDELRDWYVSLYEMMREDDGGAASRDHDGGEQR